MHILFQLLFVVVAVVGRSDKANTKSAGKYHIRSSGADFTTNLSNKTQKKNLIKT